MSCVKTDAAEKCPSRSWDWNFQWTKETLAAEKTKQTVRNWGSNWVSAFSMSILVTKDPSVKTVQTIKHSGLLIGVQWPKLKQPLNLHEFV